MDIRMGSVPLSVAAWLATDEYELLDPPPNTISATTLLKPLKSIILSLQHPELTQEGTVDAVDMLANRLGTAVHDAVERTWTNPELLGAALERLGYPRQVRDNIVVNPTECTEDTIPVYVEQRSMKEINGWNISGKFDMVMDGQVRDIKTTGTYSLISGSNDDKYALQGSIYRWLNPDLITNSHMVIDFVFKDWKALTAARDKKYPQSPIVSKTYPLLSIQATEQYLIKRTTQLNHYMSGTAAQLPRCTPAEVWQRPTVYAFYNNPGSAKATKLFDNPAEAQAWFAAAGKGEVRSRPGKVNFCKYCEARPICPQAEQYVQQKLLDI